MERGVPCYLLLRGRLCLQIARTVDASPRLPEPVHQCCDQELQVHLPAHLICSSQAKQVSSPRPILTPATLCRAHDMAFQTRGPGRTFQNLPLPPCGLSVCFMGITVSPACTVICLSLLVCLPV